MQEFGSNFARARLAQTYLAFEATRGVAPSGNGVWWPLRRDSAEIGVTRTWEQDPNTAGGRESVDAVLTQIDAGFRLSNVGIDQRVFGAHVGALLGTPTTTDAKAYGFIQFEPPAIAANSTIVINGVTWTFVASGASGEETDIEATLAATVTALAADLNASVDSDIAAATYTAIGHRLWIEADATGPSGNAITLAVPSRAVGVASAPTLRGGGLKRHVFRSGRTAQPSVSLAVIHPDVTASGGQYRVIEGARYGSMTVEIGATGRATASFEALAINERRPAASPLGGTAISAPWAAYSNLQGGLLIDDECIAGAVESGSIAIDNGMLDIRGLRCAPGEDGGARLDALGNLVTTTFSAQTRFFSAALNAATYTGDPAKVFWMLFDAATGAAVKFTLPRVQMAEQRRTYDSGGLIMQQIPGTASGQDGYSLEVEILNDVAEY